MAKETKIGLALCMLLVGAFVFVVYSKMNPRSGADGGDDNIVQSNGNQDDESDGSSTPEKDPSVQEAANNHQHDFARDQHEPDNDNFISSQQEPKTFDQSSAPQQAAPWERHTTGHQPATTNNVGQTTQSRQADPFATASQSQTVPRQEFDDESQIGRAQHYADGFGDAQQQTQQSDFDNHAEQHHHEHHAQQATDEDDPIKSTETNTAQSEPHRHQHHQQGQADEFNPFEKSASEQQDDSAMQQTDTQTDRSQFAGQHDDHGDFTQQSQEDFTQQNQYRADDEKSDPFAQTAEIDSEPHRHSATPTYADNTTNTFRSPDAESHDQNVWSRHHPTSTDGTKQQQQSVEQHDDLADSFDPYVPTQQSVEQNSDEPDGFLRQTPTADHIHQHHEQGIYGNADQQQNGLDGHLTKIADATIETYADRPTVYVVRSGDNYWNISRKQYGAGRYYKALARYNQRRIRDPQKIRPGMKVLVPVREVLEKRFPELFPRRGAVAAVGKPGGQRDLPGFFTSKTGEMLYRVGPTDTLTRIAKRHLGRVSRWVQIYALNRSHISDPGRLTIGTVLHLPADASRVHLVRNPRDHR